MSNPLCLSLLLQCLPSWIEFSRRSLSFADTDLANLLEMFTMVTIQDELKYQESEYGGFSGLDEQGVSDCDILTVARQLAITLLSSGQEVMVAGDRVLPKSNKMDRLVYERVHRGPLFWMPRKRHWGFRHHILCLHFACQSIVLEVDGGMASFPMHGLFNSFSLCQNRSLLDMLAQHVKGDRTRTDFLMDIMVASRTRPDLSLASANAASVLNWSGYSFGGLDLSGCLLRGALLSAATFEGSQLHGADLQGATLQDAWLCECNLQGAKLQGCSFGRFPAFMTQSGGILCLANLPDRRGILLGCKNGQVWLGWVDIEHGALQPSLPALLTCC